MASSEAAARSDGSLFSLPERYQQIRSVTVYLCQDLAPEDCVVQSMADVSPTKWHLAHVTWLFEHFVLEPHLPGYTRFNEQFHYLFNSYWNRITGNRLLLPMAARSFSVMFGNGPRRRIHPTPASNRWRVHSVSTTASSCVTR